jgi:hypothetical protein
VFALRGLLSGFAMQTFAALGIFAGLWAAGWLSQWLGVHWQGAQPAVVFWVLRGLLLATSVLAVTAAFCWLGDRVGKAIDSTPLAWVNRPAGFFVGAGMGTLVASLLLLVTLLVPWSGGIARTAAQSRTARPMITGAAAFCSITARYVPGSAWLKGRFRAAERRVERSARSI